MLMKKSSIDLRLERLLSGRSRPKPWWDNPRSKKLLGPEALRVLQQDEQRLQKRQILYEEKTDYMPICNGVVYFLESGDFIKIGFSSALDKRLKALGTASPHDSILLATMKANDATERAFHSHFSETRHKGEWFRKSPMLLQFIGSLMDRCQR